MKTLELDDSEFKELSMSVKGTLAIMYVMRKTNITQDQNLTKKIKIFESISAKIYTPQEKIKK